MKELLTEQQADLVVMLLSISVTLISLSCAFFQARRSKKNSQKQLWATAILFSFVGPSIWAFWDTYNSIEDHYGLDSVKALEINFGIVVGIALLFVVAHVLVRRWFPAGTATRRR